MEPTLAFASMKKVQNSEQAGAWQQQMILPTLLQRPPILLPGRAGPRHP